MFTILKPEMRRFVEKLDPYLTEAGFKIDSRHPIKDWTALARDIYSPQAEDPAFSSELNAYLWLASSLFGNNAVAYQISRNTSPQSNLDSLMEIKKRFRKEIGEKFDLPIKFILNLEATGNVYHEAHGKQGILRVGDVALEDMPQEGRWDYFFFKYMHTSDDLANLQRETEVLKQARIFDRTIDENDWAKMVHFQTFVQPKQGEYKE